MKQHTVRLQRIQELSAQLTTAMQSSYRVREHAEELKRAVDALVAATPHERRSMPRVKTPQPQPSRTTLTAFAP